MIKLIGLTLINDTSLDNKILLQRYFSKKPIKKAYLFGPFARNETTNESDIDILVELDHEFPMGMNFFSYHLDLEEILKRKVDFVTVEGMSRFIQPLIDKDKILIYERRTKRQI